MTLFESDSLAKLEFLVGRWKTTDFIYPGFVGPGGRGHGTVEFGWEMDRNWLAYSLQTELPGEGEYTVNGRMGYNPQTGHYQTVSWNSMNRMYTYRGHWKEDNTLAYQLIYPKKVKTFGSITRRSRSMKSTNGCRYSDRTGRRQPGTK